MNFISHRADDSIICSGTKCQGYFDTGFSSMSCSVMTNIAQGRMKFNKAEYSGYCMVFNILEVNFVLSS